MSKIPECFYRVSVKALVLNETKDKFLICLEDTGRWELPGGGLDWGATPQEDVAREIVEEMGLQVTKVANRPSYFFTCQTHNKKLWVANVLYETELEHLNFTPSEECREVRFVDKNDIKGSDVFPVIKQMAAVFEPKNHQ